MARPTIYTIAEKCGVSHATVSMALRNSPLVAEETRQRIQKAADKAGYRPNRLALSLKAGKSNVIGFVIPSLTYPYYALIAEYVFLEAARRGYQVQFVLSGTDIEQEALAINECLDAQVDGVIISNAKSLNELPDEKGLKTGIKRKIPHIVRNDLQRFPGVSLDHYQASMLAVRHLLEQGYEDIRLLQFGGGVSDDAKNQYSASNQSVQGFQQALKDNGIVYHPSMLVSRDVKKSEIEALPDKSGITRRLEYVEYSQFELDGIEMMQQVLADSKGKRLGVVFGQDQMACAAWHYCMDKGIRVPQDVGIVGRGNVLTYMLPLTTIGWDYREQARRFVSSLIAEINSVNQAKDSPLEPQLVIRGSTAVVA
jgi:LacI family transcriptional regulator